MALGGAHCSIRRKSTFNTHLTEIQTVLTDYIQQTNELGKNGWQKQATLFLQVLDQLQYDYSLFLLRDKTQAFCESLRSSYNYYGSSVFGDSFVQSLGSYVGIGGGSELKKNLLDLVQKIEPLDAAYISEEVLLFSIYRSREPFDIAKLSNEAKRALAEIASDSSKKDLFLEQASQYTWNIAPEELLSLIREQNKEKTNSSKSSSRYFFN